MAVKYRMNFREPNGRKFSKTAEGVDLDAATTFAAAIAGITSGTLVSATTSTDVDAGEFPDTASGGTYSDATFHFRRGTENANVHFEQLTNNYAEVLNGEETGYVDLAQTGIITFKNQWSANHGGAWTLESARYVK